MRDFPKSTSTRSQARLRLTLLLCLYIFTCCLSLVFVADLYTGYELAWFDRAGLFTAALAVVPFAVVALLFAFGRFSFGYFAGFYFYTMILGYLSGSPHFRSFTTIMHCQALRRLFPPSRS